MTRTQADNLHIRLAADLTISHSGAGTISMVTKPSGLLSIDCSSLKMLIILISRSRPWKLMNRVSNGMVVSLRGRPFFSQERVENRVVRHWHPVRFLTRGLFKQN